MKYILEFYFVLFIPLLYALNIWAISIPGSMTTSIVIRFLGLLMSLLGLIIWMLSYIHLGKHFGVLPKTQKIVSNGVYAIFLHPMYLGITYTFAGLALTNQSRIGLLFSIFVTSPILLIRAYLEDRKLAI